MLNRVVMKKSQILLLLTLLIVLVGQASGEVTLDADVPHSWSLENCVIAVEGGFWWLIMGYNIIGIEYDTTVPKELIGQEDNPDAFVFWPCES